ncbi:MAG TPA: RNA polymerase sporulation sigma factor SigH [Fimbriimonadaceae bacterium]|nr:RNA polymerase sporulation sigma factor SigH [Fimbriimonadaceae bacterium]
MEGLDCVGISRFQYMADEEVVILAREGAPGAAEFLITRYRPLVETKAKAYFVLGADHDDVVQEGMIGLFKAIRDFREERLNKFRPFAELCVTRQIITAVKTATRHKHAPLNASVSLNQTLLDDAPDGSLLDVIPDRSSADPEASLLERPLPQNLHELVKNSLSDLEQCVLRCYLDGKSYREMSEELHCRTKSIDNALQRVKRKIGTLLNE